MTISSFTINICANQRYYNIKNIPGKISIIRENSRPLVSLSDEEFLIIENNSIAKNLIGTPVSWALKDNKLFLWPISDKNIEIEVFMKFENKINSC